MTEKPSTDYPSHPPGPDPKLITAALQQEARYREAQRQQGEQIRKFLAELQPMWLVQAERLKKLTETLSRFIPQRSRLKRRRGRPRGTTVHKRETLPGQLRRVYWEHYDTHGEFPSLAVVAQGLLPSVEEHALRRYLNSWPEIQYPPPR